jgi:hypothetical protein
MGHAGAAIALVHAAGPVPDLGHHHRRAPVGLDDDPHAVGQGLFDDFGPGRQGEHAAVLPSEPEKLAQQGGGGAQPQNRLGILVSDLTAEQLRELELPHGIVIEEVVDGVGAAIGLRPGMVITAIANKPVKSAAEFNLIVKSLPANRLIAMRVLRDGVPLFVTFKLPK